MTITKLNPADWHLLEDVMDSRKSYQDRAISDERHAEIKQKGVRERLENPRDVFFGKWEGDKIVAFTICRRIPRIGEYCIGTTYAMPGLPKASGKRYAAALTELRNFAIDFFREEHMTTVWISRPNIRAWHDDRAQGSYLTDRTKFSREDCYVVPANGIIPDAILYSGMYLSSVLPTEQLVSKYTDLNPIPWPVFEAPQIPEVPSLEDALKISGQTG